MADPYTPETLHELLVHMHDAIWGPWVDPIERQNEQLEWLALIAGHIKAWRAEVASHEKTKKLLIEAVRLSEKLMP